jgi:dsDNA-specific endonuclease/ATPase MutS2
MKFKLNDKVSVLDDDLSGRIIEISEHSITIETTTGFEMSFDASELIKIENNLLNTSSFSGQSIEHVLSEKASKKRHQTPKKNTKTRRQPPMEVDLHIHQLVTSTKGMQNHDMLNLQLDTAKHRLDFAMTKGIQRIVFIHGVGEGVLKLELQYLLKRYDGIEFYPADYQKYGHGATEVYIFQNRKP